MISKFFIERPVLANVLALMMLVIGGIALFSLPVAQYPDIVPPTVQVTTRYPGANARTIIDTVALPIEQQVNGVENMLYMQSYATSDGSYTLTVTFQIGTDLNFAQVLVQNRVSSALASLPQAVQSQGVNVQKRSTAILQIVTLTSPDKRYDSLYLSNFATLRLKDEISRLPGVGNVTVFGAGQYSMRVWLDPDKMQARGLNAQDVIQALQQQSEQVTAGQIGMPPAPNQPAFQLTLDVSGKLSEPSEFADVIVKTGNSGEITRVRDVGRVELGAQTYGQVFTLNGTPAAGLAIFQSPGANALQTAQEVDVKMKALAAGFPPGIVYGIPFDTTKFVSQSIAEVYKTLVEAAILVLIVILLFLQDWRAMLVPATTVPVTIIGAFAAMAALGFTVNLSTLFAIVLAIGIVVDDAIVVVEGAAHNIEQGMSGRQAAISAMDKLFGPIIGITLVLMAVFLPASFLPGLTGRMYAQFALVIAATALLSAINAATLKPTQCALWLRPSVPPEKRNAFYRAFNAGYGRVERGYARLVARITSHSRLTVTAALIVIGLAVYGLARVPTAFLPIEDQGYFLAIVQLPDGASLERTNKALDEVSRIAQATPGVEQVITIAGVSALDNNATLANAGVAYIMLKDWSVRGKAQGLLPLYTKLNRELGAVAAARVLVLPPPPIQGIGNAGGFAMQIELRDGSFDLAKLQATTDAVVRAAESPIRDSARHGALPRQCAAIPHRGGSGEGANRQGHARSGVQRARELSRLELCRPVQRLRQSVPNLRAGGFAIPHASGGHREAHGPQQGRSHDSLGHADQDHAHARGLAHQPLQSLSVGDRRGLASARLLIGRGDQALGGDRRPHPAARHRLRVDGHLLSRKDRRQSALSRVRPGAPHRLSRARWTVRKLVHADLRAARRAAFARRPSACAARAQDRQ